MKCTGREPRHDHVTPDAQSRRFEWARHFRETIMESVQHGFCMVCAGHCEVDAFTGLGVRVARMHLESSPEVWDQSVADLPAIVLVAGQVF
jgi:hypothetical protein